MVHCIICGEETDNMQAHWAQAHQNEPPEKMRQAFAQMMPQPNEKLSKNPNYSKYYAFDTHIDMTWFDFRISAINEVSQEQPGAMMPITITRHIDATFIITPVATKALHAALGNAIAEFEAQVGPIVSPLPQK